MIADMIFGRAERGLQRRAARWFGRRPFTLSPGEPVISFTFDDFPSTALTNGGAILESFDLAGTYYTSLGLAGQTTVCGEMFRIWQLPGLLARGHELGCHTYAHCPAWETSPEHFEAEVSRNAAALKRAMPDAGFRSLSYPINYPRPETKQRVGQSFACCRGGGQVSNLGTIDLNYLAAFFIEQSADRPEVIREAILENCDSGGWLIFATHDVCSNPSPYGCTPELFREVVHFAVESGAEILPIAQAWDKIQQRSPS